MGWRDRVVQYFNAGYADPGAYDIFLAGLVHIVPVFAIAFLTCGFWERIFADNRNRPFDIGVLYTALLFTMLMPPGGRPVSHHFRFVILDYFCAWDFRW